MVTDRELILITGIVCMWLAVLFDGYVIEIYKEVPEERVFHTETFSEMKKGEIWKFQTLLQRLFKFFKRTLQYFYVIKITYLLFLLSGI